MKYYNFDYFAWCG